MRRWFGVAVLVVAVVLARPATSQDNYEGRIAGLETRVAALEAGWTAGPMDGHVLSGVVWFGSMPGGLVKEQASGCWGMRDVADLVPGARITVSDVGGSFERTGSLRAGVPPPLTDPDGGTRNYVTCEMPFEVAGLPEAVGYRIEFGDGRWLEVSYDDLVRWDWYIEIAV